MPDKRGDERGLVPLEQREESSESFAIHNQTNKALWRIVRDRSQEFKVTFDQCLADLLFWLDYIDVDLTRSMSKKELEKRVVDAYATKKAIQDKAAALISRLNSDFTGAADEQGFVKVRDLYGINLEELDKVYEEVQRQRNKYPNRLERARALINQVDNTELLSKHVVIALLQSQNVMDSNLIELQSFRTSVIYGFIATLIYTRVIGHAPEDHISPIYVNPTYLRRLTKPQNAKAILEAGEGFMQLLGELADRFVIDEKMKPAFLQMMEAYIQSITNTLAQVSRQIDLQDVSDPISAWRYLQALRLLPISSESVSKLYTTDYQEHLENPDRPSIWSDTVEIAGYITPSPKALAEAKILAKASRNPALEETINLAIAAVVKREDDLKVDTEKLESEVGMLRKELEKQTAAVQEAGLKADRSIRMTPASAEKIIAGYRGRVDVLDQLTFSKREKPSNGVLVKSYAELLLWIYWDRNDRYFIDRIQEEFTKSKLSDNPIAELFSPFANLDTEISFYKRLLRDFRQNDVLEKEATLKLPTKLVSAMLDNNFSMLKNDPEWLEEIKEQVQERYNELMKLKKSSGAIGAELRDLFSRIRSQVESLDQQGDISQDQADELMQTINTILPSKDIEYIRKLFGVLAEARTVKLDSSRSRLDQILNLRVEDLKMLFHREGIWTEEPISIPELIHRLESKGLEQERLWDTFCDNFFALFDDPEEEIGIVNIEQEFERLQGQKYYHRARNLLQNGNLMITDEMTPGEVTKILRSRKPKGRDNFLRAVEFLRSLLGQFAESDNTRFNLDDLLEVIWLYGIYVEPRQNYAYYKSILPTTRANQVFRQAKSKITDLQSKLAKAEDKLYEKSHARNNADQIAVESLLRLGLAIQIQEQ